MGQYHQVFGDDIEGNPANGKPKVVLKKLEIQQNTISGNIGILLTPTLTEANLAGNPFTNLNQNLFGPRPLLKKLNLAGTSQSDVNWIGDKLPNLEYLNVANNQLTDGGLLAISKLTKLKELDVSGNAGITDLSALAVLQNLKTITVGNNEALKKQVTVLTSGADPASKRSSIMSNKMDVIRQTVANNVANLETFQQSVNNQVKTLNDFSNNVDARVARLEAKLQQLNQACFAGTASQNPQDSGEGNQIALPPSNDAGPIFGGGRRLADCIKDGKSTFVAVDTASTAGLISVLVAMVAAVLL